METCLLESTSSDAWNHRQKLHSELRHNPAYTDEIGTDVVGDNLLANRENSERGVIRVE